MDKRSLSPDYTISDSSSTPSENMGDDNTSSKNTDSWCGTNIEAMYHNNSPWNYYIPPLMPSRHHTVLIELPTTPNTIPKPHISSNASHWDANHVRMPFSPENLFPNKEDNKVQPRWDVIQCALLRPIKNSYELEEAIFTYNLRRKKLFALHELFENEFEEDEANLFFDTLLPKIVGLALQLPELIKTPIPLLKQGKPHAVTLSQYQIACLLANAFLCTFKKELNTYPGINFNRLFECRVKDEPEVGEKIKCILHYFRRVCAQGPTGLVTFERKHSPRSLFPRWDRVETPISNIKLHISSTGTIERNGLGMLQVDFANSFIGGGVLGYGCVQEEIRFVICPELIISKLFTEELAPNESLLMIGAECYSKYKGYASTFQWVDNYNDTTPFDDFGRRRTSIIAIDAICYYNSSSQFAPSKIIRELNKAYVGFHERISSPHSHKPLSPVATGNWGCGAFQGNLHLKALIQIMACAEANRNIVYYTFGDKKLQHAVYNIYNYLAANRVTIVQLWRYLCRFVEARLPSHQLYPFIKQCHVDSLNNRTNVNNEKKKSPEVTKNLDVPSTSKDTINENKHSVSSNENTLNDVDYIENSQEMMECPVIQTPKNLKRTKSRMDDTSSTLKGKSKKTPVKVKDIGNLFYSSDEDDSHSNCKNEGLLSELDNLIKIPEPELSKSKNHETMDISSCDDELMEVCVETPKKSVLPNDNQQTPTTDTKPNSKRKLITDYYTIK